MAKRTMMDQHAELKAAHPDTVLFFRMGDFYELFHDDAEVGADVLGLTLTARDKASGTPIPMAGFPCAPIGRTTPNHAPNRTKSGRR